VGLGAGEKVSADFSAKIPFVEQLEASLPSEPPKRASRVSGGSQASTKLQPLTREARGRLFDERYCV
jgi:hypothetical protein